MFPLGFIKSMGIAGAVVAVVAATAALVISPAMFGLWGAKLGRKRPARGRRTPAGGTASRTRSCADPARSRSRRAWSCSPWPRRRSARSGRPIDSSVIPTDKSSRTVADAVAADFGGTGGSPMTIAITTDGDADDAAAVAAYADEVNALPGVVVPGTPVQLDATTWQLDVTAEGEPDGAVAQQLVEDTRAVDARARIDAMVAGPAADFVDQQSAIGSRLPLAVGLLVALTLLVLWLMTGSVVLPVKAVLMNALTVAAALGVLTFVYQDGRLTGLLGYTPNGGIEPTDFLVTATLIFALSTDYGVFLLGRIKEARDSGLGERESVAVGLQRTGAVVTAAAILLAVAIGSFSTSSISFIQQIGIATAFGVLIDAFVVRSLLVPVADGPAREVELVVADAAAPAARPDRTVRAVTSTVRRGLPSSGAHASEDGGLRRAPGRRARRDDGRRALAERRAGHPDHAALGRGHRRSPRRRCCCAGPGPAWPWCWRWPGCTP